MKTLISVANSRSGHNFVKNTVFSWVPEKDMDHINLENYFPKNARGPIENLPDHKQKDNIRILVSRDLLNWFASIYYQANGSLAWENRNPPPRPRHKIENLKHEWERTPLLEKNHYIHFIPDSMSKEDFLKILDRNLTPRERVENQLLAWLRIASELKGYTNYLPEFTKIFYDDFFISREYRQEKCREIGGIYTEKELQTVAHQGGYSSFDKDSFQNRAQEMKVLERYKGITKRNDYTKMLIDSEAFQFYIDNFEIDNDKMEFIEWMKN